MSSLKKYLFRFSSRFLIGLFASFRYWTAWAVCVFWRLIPWLSHHLQVFFSQSLRIVFLFCLRFPLLCESFWVYFGPGFFVVIFITLGGASKKILLRFNTKSALPVFSSKSLIVSDLTFRSLIHFEFLYGVRECSNFILLNCCPVFPEWLIDETIFPICCGLIDHRWVGLFLGFPTSFVVD